MAFYKFNQNNTGGSFITDDKLCHRLFIEADNSDQAITRAESLGCYWNGVETGDDCPCCGDRWYQPWTDDGMTFPYQYGKDRVFQTMAEYAEYMADQYGRTKPDCRIFYANGEVVEVFSKRVG